VDAVPAEDLAVPRGLARTIAFAHDRAGRRPAADFLASEASPSEVLQLRHLFQQLAASGALASMRKFRKERGDIWGFKLASGVRVAAFAHGRVWYLTHAFRKQRDRWPTAELTRAERIRWEHLVWLRSRRPAT
jgi:hypothetical protein